MWGAVTDAERLRSDVLSVLSWGAMTTVQIADDLEVWTQTVNQALRVLENRGDVERDGIIESQHEADSARWAVLWRVAR